MGQEFVGADGQRFNPDSRFLGGRGPVRITGTNPVVGNFFAIIPEADGATLSALVGISGTWSGCKLPVQGLWAGVGGQITSITLSTGSAIGYQL
jgi:hypothetical protein